MLSQIFGRIVIVGGAQLVWGAAKLVYYAVTYDPEAEEERLAKEKEDREREAQREREMLQRSRQLRAEQQASALAEEKRRTEHRDADEQVVPYRYRIGRHGNEALAYRYGIANLCGERKSKAARSILIRKLRRYSEDQYIVELPEFRDRKVRAVIEPGTEDVKTILPLDDSWFERYHALENAVKGGGTFTLKELAWLHVQKTVPSPSE